MYHEFFGLNEPAFSIAVNPRYLYMSDQHREALAHLVYGIQNGGFVMLTGEVGTGKTTILRCLLEQLPENTDIAFILNPMASVLELLTTICEELGASYIDDDAGVKELTDALHAFLMVNHQKGRRTVLLIDEAQLLKVPVLEQIRLLTNLETTTEKLLQIMLIGQPELKTLLARPALRQLSQRITARFHLEPLSLAETHAYISHRLSVAGMAEYKNPFTSAMIKRIHKFSGGVPRLINILCERLLLGSYAKHKQQIDNDTFDVAVREVAGTNSQHERALEKAATRSGYHGLFILVLIIIMGLVWRFVPDEAAQITEPHTAPVITEASALNTSAQSLNPASAPSHKITVSSAPTLDMFAFSQRELAAAQLDLLDYLDIKDVKPDAPCSSLTAKGFSCEKAKVNSWDELKDVNRPALMTLVTPDKKWAYVLLIGLSDNYAMLLHNGEKKLVPWSQLAQDWNGDLLYVWSRPAEFKETIRLGDQGPMVTWLAEQFAQLDKQPAALTRHFFTDKLKKRVEFFQASQKILPTGEVGAQTLRRLNEVLGLDRLLIEIDASQLPRSSVEAAASSSGVGR